MVFFKQVLLFAIVSPLVTSTPLPADKKQSEANGRIVGGTKIDISEAPYQVALLYKGSAYCGGVIFSPKIVLTAAHCTIGGYPSVLSVRAGSSQHASGGEVVRVSKIIQHPRFDYETFDYDISVLILESPLTMGSPISLATTLVNTGSLARVTGWGVTTEGGFSSDILMAVDVPIVSKEECRSVYGMSGITDRMICAGFPKGGKDACSGDFGGPMVVDGKLVGLVSWGAGCARPGKPKVYTNIYDLREFINENSK